MFQIFENFVISMGLEPSLQRALISGSKAVYESVCGSGEAIGLNSYDETHFRNLSVEPLKWNRAAVNVANTNSEHELGDDACDVNKPKSHGRGDKNSKNNHGANSKGHGTPVAKASGGHYSNMGKGSKDSKRLSSAKNNFGKFVDKLKVGQKEKAPLVRGFEDFMTSALKKQSN